jgi:FtsZ-binding cell division protein ZapB
MKTAYELAMERLNQTAPTTKLTGAQKKQLAELDSKYAAKIAEREIALQDEITKTPAAGDSEKVELLQQQLVNERKKLQTELEEKKERVRHPAKEAQGDAKSFTRIARMNANFLVETHRWGDRFGGARLPTSRNLFTAKSAKPAKIILVAPK